MNTQAAESKKTMQPINPLGEEKVAHKKDDRKSYAIPTIGRTVNFINAEGIYPAVVMALMNKELLVVSLNVIMPRGYINFIEKVPFSPVDKVSGSWHWPEIVKEEIKWPPLDPKEK